MQRYFGGDVISEVFLRDDSEPNGNGWSRYADVPRSALFATAMVPPKLLSSPPFISEAFGPVESVESEHLVMTETETETDAVQKLEKEPYLMKNNGYEDKNIATYGDRHDSGDGNHY